MGPEAPGGPKGDINSVERKMVRKMRPHRAGARIQLLAEADFSETRYWSDGYTTGHADVD